MRFSTARSLALATLVPALISFVLVPGCAKQSEGERCGDSLGAGASDDCGDGLTCTPSSSLLNGITDGAHRCCFTDGHVSDSRCEPAGPGSVPIGGAGGGGGTGGSGVAGGSIEAEAGIGGEGG